MANRGRDPQFERQSAERGRSRGRTTRRFFNTRGRGKSSSRPPPTQAQPDYIDQMVREEIPLASNPKQPQKTQAIQEIVKYEVKKQDPQHKDVTLSQFFTEWIELARTNVVGQLGDFEDKILKKYENALKGQDDIVELHPKYSVPIIKALRGGFYLATALRLLNSASSTQKGKDFAMFRLTEEISELEIPSFYNAALSNLGKFTDENYGNFRIQNPIREAKRRICRAMAITYEEVGDEFTSTHEVPNDDLKNIIGTGYQEYVFDDADSVDYLKKRGKEVFEEELKFRFLTEIANNEVAISFPYIDLENEFGPYSAGQYILSIQGFTDNIGKNGTKIQVHRDKIYASIVFQLAKDDFLNDTNNTVGQVIMELNDEKYDVIRNIKISTLLQFMNITDLTKHLKTPHLIANARVIFNFYQERAIPYIKRNIKVNMLTNSEFGTASQFIERENKERLGSRVDFTAISKFKDKNLNVFGALFGYMKKLKYHRAITSTLSASEDALLSQFVKSDMKYVK